jgi:hypothetical protein
MQVETYTKARPSAPSYSRLRSVSDAPPPPPSSFSAFVSRSRSLSGAAAPPPAWAAAAAAAAARVEALRHNFISCLVIAAQNGFGQDVEPFLALCHETWCEEQLLDAVKDLPHGALPLRDAAGNPLLDERTGAQLVDPRGKRRTRLMCAAQAGDVARLRWLLARGARMDLKDWQGFTALHWACQAGRLATAVALIERGAPVAGDAAGGLSPLLLASYHSRVHVVRELLARGAPFGQTLMPGGAPSADRPPSVYAGVTPLCASLRAARAALRQKRANPLAPRATLSCSPFIPPLPSPRRTHTHTHAPRRRGGREGAPGGGARAARVGRAGGHKEMRWRHAAAHGLCVFVLLGLPGARHFFQPPIPPPPPLPSSRQATTGTWRWCASCSCGAPR